MKYIILANSNDRNFEVPRQLAVINGEPLVVRTIRLLKENGVKDIIICAKDERFNHLGAIRYTPTNNDYDYQNKETTKGYWLNAFPQELMGEPICYIWGDVYFSDEAIKTIVNTDTKSHLFFCTYRNESKDYIKHHDEPLAYKVVDTELFKKHIELVKSMYDRGLTARHPIVWELYRSLNGIDVNEHIMTKNYVAINDISCDIDCEVDIARLKYKLGEFKMVRLEITDEVDASRFNEVKELIRSNPLNAKEGHLYIGDKFLADKELAEYFTGKNKMNKSFAKVIEVIPDKKEVKKEEVKKTRGRKSAK